MYRTQNTGESHRRQQFRGFFLPVSLARKVLLCTYKFLCIFETLPHRKILYIPRISEFSIKRTANFTYWSSWDKIKLNFIDQCKLFTSKLDLNLRKKLEECYICSKALKGAENWLLQKVNQKYIESFEMWCWRRIQKIGWTDRVINEELWRIKEERNILQK